jgi:hypothetical protein
MLITLFLIVQLNRVDEDLTAHLRVPDRTVAGPFSGALQFPELGQ